MHGGKTGALSSPRLPTRIVMALQASDVSHCSIIYVYNVVRLMVYQYVEVIARKPRSACLEDAPSIHATLDLRCHAALLLHCLCGEFLNLVQIIILESPYVVGLEPWSVICGRRLSVARLQQSDHQGHQPGHLFIA